jgi:hypothetical protein
LGGRRETVTVAAGHLQDAGIIHYNRGRITIIDRAGLEKAVCECYRAVKSECDRILLPGGSAASQPAAAVLARSRASRARN